MKKRLRKKLRLGEFRQFGFEVSFRLPDDLDEAGVDGFWDVFVTRTGRASATDEDRTKLAEWLGRHALISDMHIGPLVDAWHSA